VAGLSVLGAVGKATTGAMVDAILRATGTSLPSDVLVLLSQGDDARHALESLPDESPVVANADSVPASWLPPAAVTFGLGDRAELSASEVDATMDGTSFTLTTPTASVRVTLRVLGEHQVTNALAALAVAQASRIPLELAVSALEGLDSVGAGRMERLSAPREITVINDAVSATPQSAAAALKALAQVSADRRSVAVLGELSVGDEDAQSAHDRIGRLIVRLNIKKLIVIGHSARHIHNAAGLEGSWDGESVLVGTLEEAYDFLREELREKDVVLVKGMKGSGLDHLAHRLAEVTR
jgi:UDP-N-acetylmuramoyl-tripeptide--D-alanyl-D-alanine ligase